jgi:hypothetical protein
MQVRHVYSVVSTLGSMLDLNSLHDLALCCRQFRANLLEYRDQLVKHTLKCSNEDEPTSDFLGNRFRESHATFLSFGYNDRITSGKVGICARDMVGECRKCDTVVCRVGSE